MKLGMVSLGSVALRGLLSHVLGHLLDSTETFCIQKIFWQHSTTHQLLLIWPVTSFNTSRSHTETEHNPCSGLCIIHSTPEFTALSTTSLSHLFSKTISPCLLSYSCIGTISCIWSFHWGPHQLFWFSYVLLFTMKEPKLHAISTTDENHIQKWFFKLPFRN